MRLWMVNPQIMCISHLMGEHRECHALLGSINKLDRMEPSLRGLADMGAIATSKLKERHDALVEESKRRGLPSGLNHGTPLEYEDKLNYGVVDPEASLQLLIGRCEKCKIRYNELQAKETIHG